MSSTKDNFIEPGAHRFPRAQGEGYEAKLPLGKDIVVAVLSKSRLNLGEKEEYTWNEVFARLGNQDFSTHIKSRGQGAATAKPLGYSEWQAVTLVLETIN